MQFSADAAFATRRRDLSDQLLGGREITGVDALLRARGQPFRPRRRDSSFHLAQRIGVDAGAFEEAQQAHRVVELATRQIALNLCLAAGQQSPHTVGGLLITGLLRQDLGIDLKGAVAAQFRIGAG